MINYYIASICNLQKKFLITPLDVKGTHAVSLSSSFYIINQRPMIPRTDFNCKPHGLHILLGEIRQCICLFCGFVFTSQGRCDRNFSKVATARGFARGLLALAKSSARCDRNP